MHTTNHQAGDSEWTILARLLSNGDGELPAPIARYILTLDFSDRDKARMHDLAVRNQEGALSPAEREELFAYVNAGSLLSILQSKARRDLKVKPKKRVTH
jgi:hypothetical protein